MATIPAGLRGDVMRSMMEDKNTLTAKGGLYVGSGTTTTVGGTTIRNTEQLVPGTAGYPLVSKGSNGIGYQKLGADGIADGAIQARHIQDGAIPAAKVGSLPASKISDLSVSYNSQTGTLTITF